MAWNDYINKVMTPSANWWDKKLSDKQRFQLQAPQDPSLLNVAAAVPNPVGDVASGLLAVQDVSKGNYGSAALNSLGLLPFVPAMGAITAFHGSPYKFDKFDSAKIGSGEGAQAYGHGLYFAESPKVAESYSKIEPAGEIASPRRTILGQEVEPRTPEYKAAQLVDELGLNKAKKFASDWLKNSRPDEIDYASKINTILSSVSKKSDVKNLGTSNLYKVDIADEAIPKMLDFEKPLYKQSQAVKEIALEYMPALQERLKFTGGDGVFGLTGSDLFGIMQRYQPGGKKPVKGITGQDVTSKLMSKGIPGSRYLDQSSRVGGSGTSNYVVFDPEKIKILERNGLLTK